MTTAMKVPNQQGAENLIPGADGTTTLHPAAVGPIFYNTTAPEWIERAQSLLSAEPMVVFSTPLHLTAQGYGSVKRAYIECTEDNAVPVALQRLMQKDLPCHPVFTLTTDHSPFYSAPSQLIACLQEMI